MDDNYVYTGLGSSAVALGALPLGTYCLAQTTDVLDQELDALHLANADMVDERSTVHDSLQGAREALPVVKKILPDQTERLESLITSLQTDSARIENSPEYTSYVVQTEQLEKAKQENYALQKTGITLLVVGAISAAYAYASFRDYFRHEKARKTEQEAYVRQEHLQKISRP